MIRRSQSTQQEVVEIELLRVPREFLQNLHSLLVYVHKENKDKRINSAIKDFAIKYKNLENFPKIDLTNQYLLKGLNVLIVEKPTGR